MASCLSARVQDEFHFHFMKSKFKPHRIFMRIHEPLHPGMEHSNLGLGALPDFNQGGRLIDKLAMTKNRNEQIFKCRFRRQMFAAG